MTPRTKAILPVDLYGLTPDMASLRAVADRHGFASSKTPPRPSAAGIDDRPPAALATCRHFSFHGTKTMTTGEGGMLVTDRTDVYERAWCFAITAAPKTNFKFFYNTEVAFKYRMSNMQAAFGLAQLERLRRLVAKKRQIFRWYAERLGDVAGFI